MKRKIPDIACRMSGIFYYKIRVKSILIFCVLNLKFMQNFTCLFYQDGVLYYMVAHLIGYGHT